MSAQLIAQRRRELDDAVAAHAAALRAVDEVAGRIAERTASRNAITQRRLNGSAEARDTAELYALGEDLRVLGEVLVERQQRAAALDPAASRSALAAAEAEHAREQASAEFVALHDRLMELDNALVACLSATCDAAARIGKTRITEVYRPSEKLDRALRLGVRP